MYVAARCHARSKRSGLQYRRGRFGSNVCRMHGGRGGATEGTRNAVKHGEFAVEALCVRTTGAKSELERAVARRSLGKSVHVVIDWGEKVSLNAPSASSGATRISADAVPSRIYPTSSCATPRPCALRCRLSFALQSWSSLLRPS